MTRGAPAKAPEASIMPAMGVEVLEQARYIVRKRNAELEVATKALDAHLLDFDDYADAVVIPEACVRDVIRARAGMQMQRRK